MQIFSKDATETDVNIRFSVPVAALEFLPDFGEDHAVDIQVRDIRRQVYDIRCCIREEGHPKPVFAAGWRKFIRCKDVKVGDKIIFHFEQDHATGVHYKIEVKRRINLLGSLVWADV